MLSLGFSSVNLKAIFSQPFSQDEESTAQTPFSILRNKSWIRNTFPSWKGILIES